MEQAGGGWLVEAQRLIATDLAEEAHAAATAAVVAGCRRVPLLAVIEGLGPDLSTDNSSRRARAVALLTEVVTAVPEAAATPGDVHHLAEFFTARLTDWPAIHGALRGLLALFRRPAGLPPLDTEDAVAALRTVTGHVFVRSLAQAERGLALELLHAAVDDVGQALLDAHIDLLEWAIASVDGEKDPRCLLAAFGALRALLALYAAQPEHSVHVARLEEAADELFDVVACYFPISFTPPPDNPHGVTRPALAAGLEATLVACPLFAPHLLPLLLEKLASTLRQAKLDSLSALGAAAAAFPPDAWAPHTSAVWAALRSELLAPAGGALLDAELPAVEEMAGAAAACLTRCLAVLQAADAASGSSEQPSGGGAAAPLLDAVLGDASLQDLESCVRSPGVADASAFRRSVLRVSALARVLAALAQAGGPAARKAAALLPRVLTASASADQASAAASACLAWAAVTCFLRAAGGAELEAALVQQLATQAAAAAAGGAAGAPSSAGVELAQEDAELWSTGVDACTQQRVTWLRLAALEALAGAPQLAAALQAQQVDAALAAALANITGAARSDGVLCKQASATLAALASSGHAAAVSQEALPALLAAATSPERGKGALAALQALAATGPELQAEVLIALDGAIQSTLPSAAASADGAALACALLSTASSVVIAAASRGAQAMQRQSGQLAQHLMDAVLLPALPAPAAAAASQGAALVTAAAEAACHAAGACDTAWQARLAGAAAEALLAVPPPAGLAAAVCSAALLPCSAEALAAALPAAADSEPVVARLVAVALGDGSSGSDAGSVVGRFAALAAASVLNKAAPEQLAACLNTVLEGPLLRATLPADAVDVSASSAAGSSAGTAWAALAAVTQGLVMRGHPQGDAVVSRVLDHVQRLSTEPGGSTAGPSTRAAAGFLRSVLASDAGPHAVALNTHSRAAAKPLWQQRMYTKGSSQLLAALQARLQSRGGADAAAAPASQAPPPPPQLLLAALAQLLRGAPSNVVAGDMPRMLPWVLRCLAALPGGPWADAELLCFLLRLVATFLGTDPGKSAAEEELATLVPLLLDLAAWQPGAEVRDSALDCLRLLAQGLPYTALHPYRPRVAKAAAAACDDHKRVVRLQAARVRQAWSS